MPETFAELEQLTPNGSVILCWWDYGTAVRQWSHREVIEAYPSRDIWNTVGSSRDPLNALEAQLFGTWGSSEKTHDLARIFMLPEDQSLQTMQVYNVSYALVFTPDDLQKFNWIANYRRLQRSGLSKREWQHLQANNTRFASDSPTIIV